MLDRCLPLFRVILLLLIVTPCLAQFSRPLTPGLKRDRSALLALVNSMDKLGRSRMGAWKAKGNPCSPKPWPHISCKNGRVSAIDLANLDLIGTLPPQLKRLNKLESMNMENNQLAGPVPEAWSDGQQFQALRSISLANNLLSGSLPNAKWNRKNAFRSLEELNLAENRLTGGLPDGWLGANAPFRKLKLLDLSDNQLGSSGPYTPSATIPAYGWCLQHATDGTRGWCPTGTAPNNRLPILEILDLSHNDLEGELPTMWARMFPNLQSLLIHSNGLYSGVDKPAALPDTWTLRTVPRAFPQLQTLVLYPGNTKVCSIPKGDGNFEEINGKLSYVVESEDEMEFDENNPWFCPEPANDAAVKPTNLALSISATKLRVSFTGLEVTTQQLVYGYRVSLYKQDPDTLEYEPVSGYIAKLYQVYPAMPSGSALSTGPPASYTLDTVEAAGTAGYKVEVTAVTLSNDESSAAVFAA